MKPSLRLAPTPDESAEHRPVCAACGGAWPCAERRATDVQARQAHRLTLACWSCGKDAKSATGFGVMTQGRGLVLARWCGLAKHRRCHEVGMLYRDADLRSRRLRAASTTADSESTS